MSKLTSETIDLADQIGGDGFDPLKQDDVEEQRADEPLIDDDIINLVNDNEKNVGVGN